jgi:hypothetical protein
MFHLPTPDRRTELMIIYGDAVPQDFSVPLRKTAFLAREEGARSDPEFREGFEICLVRAGDGVFLSALDSKAVFSRRKRPDFFYKRSVHEHRSVDADESVGFELFCHHRNRLPQQVGTRVLLEPNTFTFSLYGNHVAQTDK